MDSSGHPGQPDRHRPGDRRFHRPAAFDRFSDAASAAVCRKLPGAMVDVLLHLFSRWITPPWQEPGTTREILDALRATFFSDGARSVSFPPMPTTAAVSHVARQLADDPSDPRSIEDWAGEAGMSVRHLTRLFMAETGMSFNRWRSTARGAVAARSLSRGATIAEAARLSGYASTASLSHALQRQLGMSPGMLRSTTGIGQIPADKTAPRVPAGRMLPIVNARHVLVWMARGSARVRLNNGQVTLARGDLLWLPSGVWHDLSTDPGGVILPVGSLPTEFPLSRKNVVAFRPAGSSETELLYRAAVSHTLVRPYPWNAAEFAGGLTELLPSANTAQAPPEASSAKVARILRETPSTSDSLTRWSVRLGVPRRDLARAFQRVTGSSYRQWSVERRMSVARAMLRRPTSSVSDVAVRAGYGSVVSFVRAFRNRNGMTPGEFRMIHLRREVFDAVE